MRWAAAAETTRNKLLLCELHVARYKARDNIKGIGNSHFPRLRQTPALPHRLKNLSRTEMAGAQIEALLRS